MEDYSLRMGNRWSLMSIGKSNLGKETQVVPSFTLDVSRIRKCGKEEGVGEGVGKAGARGLRRNKHYRCCRRHNDEQHGETLDCT